MEITRKAESPSVLNEIILKHAQNKKKERDIFLDLKLWVKQNMH